MRVNSFVEKIYSTLDREESILRRPMKTRQVSTVKTDSEAAESFAQYLKFWTEVANDLNPRKVEELADKKGAQVSGSKVSSAINGLVADHRMRTLEAIALAIGRPPERST
jgi:hypothetical protein